MKFLYQESSLITADEIKQHFKTLVPYLKEFRRVQNTKDYGAPESFINLPSDKKILREVQDAIVAKTGENLKYVLVIGIGGSDLITKAIYEALHQYYDVLEISRYPKIIFIDSVSPEFLAKLDFFLESRIQHPEELLINIISRSGTTLETIANAEFLIHDLKRRFEKITERIVVTTELNSQLWQVATVQGITCLAMPAKTGGRFSALSAVALLPLTAAKINIAELLAGCLDINEVCLNEDPLENPAALSAIITFLHYRRGIGINDNFLFHPELESLGKWYRQLLAESIGKEKNLKGEAVSISLTPTVSIGPADLHSVGQLYLNGNRDRLTTFVWSEHINSTIAVPRDRMFQELTEVSTGRAFGQILNAILTGAKTAYADRKLPFVETILPDISERSLGQFIHWKMIEVALLAKLFNINCFDQPNVESYKQESQKVLAGLPLESRRHEDWSNTVVYQIYPRSFKDSNGDGIGDLQGIIDKLDYLNDGSENSLGINAIWLNPIYKSPQNDFGYDISDYCDIDKIFGDLEIFNRFVDAARRRNIKVIMDFVPNHTSVEHPWFLESRSSLNNPKRDWYIWRDPKPDGSPPNNWLSVFGGSAWTYNVVTKQYYLHSFLPSQPDLNWHNQEVKDAMMKVMKFWLHHGVDGFRTDAAYHLIKDGQFRDDPLNPNYRPGQDDPYNQFLHIYSAGQPELFKAANSFCEILGAHENKFIVSEAYLDIAGMGKLYRACDNNLHAPLNFNLISLPWDALAYKKFIDKFNHSLTKEQIPNYTLSNHDRPRAASRLGRQRARLAAMIMMTLRGMPFIYYGDELGMENGADKNTAAADFLSRDPERTPMQWSAEANAGFSEAEPWLPVTQNYQSINVEKELLDSQSMLSLYKKLVHHRLKSPALKNGGYRSLKLNNDNVFAYLRETADEKILVVINFSDTEQKIAVAEPDEGVIICNSHLDKKSGEEISLADLKLRPNEGYILDLKS